MSEKIIILEKTYEGFESSYDLGRDIEEMWVSNFNPVINRMVGEWSGKLKVTVEYEGDDLKGLK